jgi:hypothetical protein
LKGVVSTTTVSVLFLDTDQVKAQVLEYIEHVQAPLVIVLILIIFVVILYTWNGLRRKSFVYMDIGDGSRQVLIKLAKLPDSRQNFRLIQTTTKFSVKNFGAFSVVFLDTPWKIQSGLTGKSVELRRWGIVSCMAAKKLSKLTTAQGVVVLALLIHTHSLEYVKPNTPIYRGSVDSRTGDLTMV